MRTTEVHLYRESRLTFVEILIRTTEVHLCIMRVDYFSGGVEWQDQWRYFNTQVTVFKGTVQ